MLPIGRWVSVLHGENYRRWFDEKGDDLGHAAWQLGNDLESAQTEYEVRAQNSLRLYDGRQTVGLRSGGYISRAAGDRNDPDLDYNLSRAGVDTVHAEIAGRQKPVAKFQTSDADWATKRRAKKMEKFCTAVLRQRQGIFLNAWELQEATMRDSAVWGMGVSKVFSKDGKIVIERHFAHELYVDPAESIYGDPQNLFHVYYVDRDRALWAFARDPSLKLSKKARMKMEMAIEAADDVDQSVYGDHPRVVRSVKIVEAWRLQFSKTEPGKHVFAINNALLFEEDWARPEFPFVFQRWEPDLIGWRAKGLVEQGESIHMEVNNNAEKLQERFRLCGGKRTYIEAGSVKMEDMQANEAEVIVQLKKGTQMKPIDAPPKPVNESEVTWLESNFQKYFELTGVSQMRASARKEPGVTAGVAIRTLNDMQTARFALKAKGYENSYIQLTNQIIYCAREMAEAQGDVTVKYDEEIKWKEVELPEDTFDITIAPTSSLPNDPAGRMQMTQELYSAGVINVETFKQLLGWPDLEKEMNYQTAQGRWLEKLIDRMLDEGDEYYEPPDGHIIDKPHAMMQMSQAYFDALYDDAPEDKLSLLRNWMSELDTMMVEAQKAAALAAAEMQQALQAKVEQTVQGEPGGEPPPGPGNRPQLVAEETQNVG